MMKIIISLSLIFLAQVAFSQKSLHYDWSEKKINFEIQSGSVYKKDVIQTIKKIGFGTIKSFSEGDPEEVPIPENSVFYTHYDKELSFITTIFLKKVNFVGSLFDKNVRFDDSKFKKNVGFDDSNFLGEFAISESIFSQDVTFNCSFSKNSSIDFTTFQKGCDFSYCRFDEKASFSLTTFLGESNFSDVRFSKEADFSDAVFYTPPNFNGTQLPDTLYFDGVKLIDLKEPIRFDLAETDSIQRRNGEGIKCKIFLTTNTEINKLVLDGFKFELVFDEDTKFDEKVAVFEQVIRKNKEMGFQESAKGFDMEFQKLKMIHDFPISGKLLVWINKYWWNFGYEKWRILFIFLPLFYIFFCVINFLNLDSLIKKVYFNADLGKNLHNAQTVEELITTFKSNKWAKFKYILQYTGTIYFGLKVNHEALNFDKLGWIFYYYLVYLIGIFHVAFSLNYVLSK